MVQVTVNWGPLTLNAPVGSAAMVLPFLVIPALVNVIMVSGSTLRKIPAADRVIDAGPANSVTTPGTPTAGTGVEVTPIPAGPPGVIVSMLTNGRPGEVFVAACARSPASPGGTGGTSQKQPTQMG